ncbi:MAG: anti-sigma factor antagonist [Acidimicrobiales bacterium]|nr:anti-sigma factor antagonist [Acidimicrobiales bacterium]
MTVITIAEGRAVGFRTAASVVGGRMVVSVQGELDIATAPKLYDALDRAQAHLHPSLFKTPLVVDMSRVTFVDASGLRALVAAATRGHREGRDIVLRDPTPATLRVLDLTGLLDVFSIESPALVVLDVA